MAALAARTVKGALAAMASAMPRAASSSSAAPTTRLTRPMRSASAASKRRAVNMISRACAGPTSAVSTLMPPKP